MPPKTVSPELFFDTINAYQRSAALKTAIELGLFTAIGGGGKTPQTAPDLAARCRIAPRGARILCDYLVTLGFLTKHQDRYALTPDSAMFLDSNSPAYIGTAVEFLDSDYHRDCFAALPDRVRAGGAPLTRDSVLAPGHDVWVKFARGMASLQTLPARLFASHVLSLLPTARPLRVLDIAAGHGMFGIAILQQNPHARVVAQDWPNVLEVAREHAAKAAVLNRYDFLPGDAFHVDLDPAHAGYDLVLIPNLLHHFDPPANIALLKRAHAALKPGGTLALLEFVPDENRTTPQTPARFALVMLACTPGGDAYTFSELQSMLQNAGFANISLNDLPPTFSRLLLATKPSH